MDGAQVGIFEKTDQVSFGGFLESQDSGALESQVTFEFLGDFSNQSLERELSQKEISRFLIFSDFSEGNGTGSESVGFLDTSGGGGGLSSLLGSKGFSWSFLSSGFSSGQFSSSHFKF